MPISIAIRLGVEGGPELKRTLEDAGAAGQAAFQKTAAAADQAGAATDRQMARYQRLAQAAREAEAQARAQSAINQTLGVRVDADMAGSARQSAAVFEQELGRLDQIQAARQERVARTAQASINTLLGVRDAQIGAARASASVFEEEFRRETEALRRATEARAETLQAVANRQAAQQAAQTRSATYQSALNDRLGVRTDFGTFGRAEDIAAYGAELDRVRARFVPLAAAGQAYRQELADIAQAARTGTINETERAAAVKRTKDAFADQVREIRNASAETRRLRPDQLQNLLYQGTDVITSLASGMPLGTVALQQGGQIAGVFGPGTGPREVVSGVAQAIGKLITPLTVTATAITAAAATFAYAASSFSAGQREVRASVTGPGRLSGATPEMINQAAESSARAGEVPVSTAREIASVYASTGRVAPQFFNDLIKLQRDYAAQTKQDIIPSAQELAGAFTNVATGVDLIESRVGPLGDGVGEAAKKLAAAGDQVGAVKLIVEALPRALTRANDNLGTFSREWERSVNAVKGWSDLVGGSAVGTASRTAVEARVAQIEARIGGILASQQRYGSSQNAATYEATLRTERQRLAEARAELDRERTAAPRAQVDDRASAASRVSTNLNPELAALELARANRTRIELSLRDAVRTDIAPAIQGGAGNAYATLQTLNEQIRLMEENYKAGGEAAANALKRADFENRITGLSDYERALEAVRKKYEDLRDAATKSGDAATREQRLATLDATEKVEVATLAVQTRLRARSQVEIPADYFATIRTAESSGNDAARSPTGAVGRYQFTAGTWLEMFRREKDALYADIQSRYTDPRGADAGSVRRDVLALRTDPALQEDLVRALTQRNAEQLASRGFEVSSRNLYGAHNIGVGGISALLQAQREGRGDVTAQSVLDPIDTDLVRGNREYYGKGKTVDEALATLQRKTFASNADARSSRDRASAVDEETRSLDRNAAQQERATAINEQLRAARERGEEVGLQFKNAEELQAAAAKGLTGDLKAQTDAILANAGARERAVRTNLSARFERDMKNANDNLGRTSSEQVAYQQARLYETPGTKQFDEAYSRIRDLQGMTEAKNLFTDSMTGFITDISHGGDAMKSFASVAMRVGDRLIAYSIDSFTSAAFKSAGGGGGGGFLDFLGSVLGIGGGGEKATGVTLYSSPAGPGFADGGYTGHGARLEPAGIVHKGEVVWSQADVARVGGVAAAEAMRRGLSGYADGGAVMPGRPTPWRPAAALRGGSAAALAPITINDNRTLQTIPREGVSREEFVDALRQSSRELIRSLPGQIRDIQRRMG